MFRESIRGTAGALLLAALIACGDRGEAATKDGAANGAANGAPGARGGAAGNAGGGSEGGSARGGAPGAPGGMAGGRGSAMQVLAATDVAEVAQGPIEMAIAIQGDLKPVEEIAVRARIEGNVEQVLVREGDRVVRGTLMARFESSNQESVRKSAEADVISAKAEVENARWNAEQSAELFKAGAIPERDARSSQQALAAAEARLAAAEARVRASTQDVEDTRIVAPTTGVVSARNVETGEHVTRGATVFTVVRNDVLELQASVPARMAADVKPSQPVRFSAGGRELTGRVARISPTINPANRSLTVYLQVPNPGGALKGNTYATGRIVARTIADALVVPTSAIRYAQQQAQPFVYKIVNETVEFQPVQLGVIDEAMGVVQVTDGLSAGDRIIVGNVGALGRGVKVRIASTESGRSGRGARPVPRP